MNSDLVNSGALILHLFSIGCALFVVVSYFRFAELRTPGFTIVSLISMCDAAANISYISFPPPNTGSADCYAQALLISFFVAASVLWSMVISLTIYATVLGALGRPARFLTSILDRPIIVHAVVWGWALALALLPLSTNSTGHDAGPLCWLATETAWGKFWVYFTAFGFLWVIVAVIVLITCRIRFAILAVVSVMLELEFKHQTVSDASRQPANVNNGYTRLLTFYNTLKWYPVILIIAWTRDTILRVAQSFGYTMSATIGGIFKLVTASFFQGQ